MVYQGKPSAGCANCRKRKIKCDEGKPACSQCLNTKRECPGYLPRFDLVLRDQTKAVRRKAQRKAQPSDGTPAGRVVVKCHSISPVSTSSSSDTSPTFTTPRDAWFAQKKKADNAVPRMFNDFPEQQAICAFFLDFVMLPRHPDTVRGHLEHLQPLYKNASPDSPLSLATSSVALVISSDSPARCRNQQLGRKVFGKALQKTSTAIRDPAASMKDETLMAVLLLGLFERITASADVSKVSLTSTHSAGAAALIKHRGQANCSSPLAIGLTFAVRTQLVEAAIETGTAFKRCPDGLAAIFRNLPQNASARLTSATTNIADLRSCARSALSLPYTPAAQKEVNDLIEYAVSIDLLVGAWPESLPEEWRWTRANGFDLPLGPIPKSAFVYCDHGSSRVDTYLDLWVMSIWNQYRSARIKIQSIILDCIDWLGGPYEAQWYWRSIYAQMITQEMTDDICASAPFALGTKTLGGPGDRDGVEYPFVDGKKVGAEHRRAAAAMGGWHLLDPLKSSLRTTCLRDGQQKWITGQMERIGRIYNLHGQKGQGGVFDRHSFEFPV